MAFDVVEGTPNFESCEGAGLVRAFMTLLTSCAGTPRCVNSAVEMPLLCNSTMISMSSR